MLEIWNFVRKYTHTHVVSEDMPFSTMALIILLMSTFFGKNSTFTQSNSVTAVLEIF